MKQHHANQVCDSRLGTDTHIQRERNRERQREKRRTAGVGWGGIPPIPTQSKRERKGEREREREGEKYTSPDAPPLSLQHTLDKTVHAGQASDPRRTAGTHIQKAREREREKERGREIEKNTRASPYHGPYTRASPYFPQKSH